MKKKLTAAQKRQRAIYQSQMSRPKPAKPNESAILAHITGVRCTR